MNKVNELVNPVLPGFYPDPSVCRVNNDFYLVNSSFSYFPGIPICHSTDLVHWEQIGNVIDRESQMSFEGAGSSRGLFAPTIRYCNGLFYVICTLVDKGGNFYVTAENPAGPWSDPIYINAPGIDPSLFFDDDGTVWYIGTREAPEGPAWFGNWEIWVQQLDLATGKLIGESHGIWRGALKRCVWPEGPHIYKINGTYYLLHAEGGTSLDHAVCVAKCDSVLGEWEGKKANPILTHRHLGKTASVINVGHADLFDDVNGNYWMVCLASRPAGEGTDRVCALGRETFIVPVIWEDGWPVVSPETGLVNKKYIVPVYENSKAKYCQNDKNCSLVMGNTPEYIDFTETELPLNWITLRNRNLNKICLDKKASCLSLSTQGESLRSVGELSFVGRRQQHFTYKAATMMEFTPLLESQEAGIAIIQSENAQYRFACCLKNSKRVVRLIKADCTSEGSNEVVLFESEIQDGAIVLKVNGSTAADKGGKLEVAFEYAVVDSNCKNIPEKMTTFYKNADASFLSTERAGGFIGNVLGLYASGGGDNFANFDWWTYEGINL